MPQGVGSQEHNKDCFKGEDKKGLKNIKSQPALSARRGVKWSAMSDQALPAVLELESAAAEQTTQISHKVWRARCQGEFLPVPVKARLGS